jgi:hypothetical protein
MIDVSFERGGVFPEKQWDSSTYLACFVLDLKIRNAKYLHFKLYTSPILVSCLVISEEEVTLSVKQMALIVKLPRRIIRYFMYILLCNLLLYTYVCVCVYIYI